MYPVTVYKNRGATSDLKELMECAVSALWGKWFQTETELGTKDDWKALVCARGWCIKGKEWLCLLTWGTNTLVGK